MLKIIYIAFGIIRMLFGITVRLLIVSPNWNKETNLEWPVTKQMLSKLLFAPMIGSSRKNTKHYNRALTETNLGPCQIDTDQARVLWNWMKLSSFNLTRFQLRRSQFDRTLVQFDKGRLWSLSIWQWSLNQLHRVCAIKKVHGSF